jgi:ribosome maturation protein SDO1
LDPHLSVVDSHLFAVDSHLFAVNSHLPATLQTGSQILADGEAQVSEKEREQKFENLFRDVVNVLVEKTINPETSRPYPPGMIEKSLRDLHFSADTTKPAKVQALEWLPKLQTCMPIRRADMRLRIQVPR